LSLHQATSWLGLADRLCGTMPAVVAALEAGRIDLAPARTIATETEGLTAAQMQKMEQVVLAKLPPTLDRTAPVGPWDAAAPKAFTAMVRRAVAKVREDGQEQVLAEVRERTGTWLQVDPANPALATWTVTGPTEQLIQLEEAIGAKVRSMTSDELAGRTHGMAKVDLIAAALTGDGSGDGCGTGSGGGVRRELGVVLHADTLFGAGPATDDPGQVRGIGHPVPVTAATARVLAGQTQTRKASTCVLPADDTGHPVRLLRVGAAPRTGWTRTTLVAAARRALEKHPHAQHETHSYEPTVEIAETVRARDPVCTFPGCGVPAGRCDLDHVMPHPRGPTSVTNLSPRSRRCHRFTTAALWHCCTRTRTRPAGTTAVTAHEWTSPLGTRQVAEVEALPGHAVGEAYACA